MHIYIYEHMYGYDSFTPDSWQAPVALTFDQQTQKQWGSSTQ